MITYYADDTILQQAVTLPPTSRTTIFVNNIIVPLAKAFPSPKGVDPYAVSIDVQVVGPGTVVAERPEYFDYSGDPGGTDVLGYTGG